jgi:glyoxylase-like metal-dependent hydrolase (beta-lactamase superfamily II)
MPLIHKIDHPAVEGIRVGKQSRKGHYRINTSCIIYRLGDTIIDTGPANEWKTVRSYLEERSVKQALLTHYHEDHSGNCGNLECCFNSVILSHHNNHDKIRDGYTPPLSGRIIFGDITLAQPQQLPAAVETTSHSILTPLHMPGHTDDTTSYFEANNGWLFSGDMYVSSRVRYALAEENINEQILSLQQAIALDFDELFCAHQGYIKNGKQALQKKLDFLISLRDNVLMLHNKGYSHRQIRNQLFGREDISAYLSLFAISKINLVRACLR